MYKKHTLITRDTRDTRDTRIRMSVLVTRVTRGTSFYGNTKSKNEKAIKADFICVFMRFYAHQKEKKASKTKFW